MAIWAVSWRRGLVGLVVGLALAGCSRSPKPVALAAEPGEAKPEVAASASAGDAAVAPKADAPAGETPAAGSDRLHQTFVQATRRGDDPPPESNRPPDTTVSGKAVYKLYTEVQRLWDTIRFVTPEGKRIDYSATLETDAGPIELALFPDAAPNHVRNFVALARAGYYDQLFFERVRHEESEDEPGVRLDALEGGCPLGTGEPGQGSIGYWLNPEFDAKLAHEEGTVGACHGTEADTAACRFYITLCKAPFLDGNYTVFGKVTHGLDVARIIFNKPVIIDDQDQNGARRPEKPIMIRKVTIHTSEVETGPGPAEGKR